MAFQRNKIEGEASPLLRHLQGTRTPYTSHDSVEVSNRLRNRELNSFEKALIKID
jgi:hypothetical protein